MGDKIFYVIILDADPGPGGDIIHCVKQFDNPSDVKCGQVTIPPFAMDVSGCDKNMETKCTVTITNITPPKDADASVWKIVCPG